MKDGDHNITDFEEVKRNKTTCNENMINSGKSFHLSPYTTGETSGVHSLRMSLKQITKTVLNYSPQSQTSFVDKQTLYGNTVSSSTDGSDNTDSTKPSSSSERKEHINRTRKNSWDEVCVGLWIQDKFSRERNLPGRCYGLEVVKIDNVCSGFRNLLSLMLIYQPCELIEPV
jgi:hypothetical protein